MLPVRSENPSADMAAVMARVRKMSDSQLADILSGKDMSVPQFAAMSEAMGRKQLRQAVDGQQAQQQAQQPSVKDQLLAEEQSQGIAGLPAPNMEAMGEGRAAGGIIAFDKGGLTDEEYDRQRRQSDMWKRAREDNETSLWNTLFGPGISGIAAQKEKQKILATPITEPSIVNPEDPYNKATPVVTDSPISSAAPAVEPPPTAPASPKKDAKKDSGAPASSAAVPTDFTFNPRKSRMEGLKTEAVDYEKLKDQGFGEGLMKMAAGFMSKPTLAGGASAGLEALAASGAATRKEIAGLKKDARDYDLLVAKANDEFDKGNDELGLKYKTAAETSKYHDIMGKAAMITAGAHATTAEAAAEKPDMQLFKLTQDSLTNRLKTDIQFKQKFNQLSPDDQMAYLKNMYQQNKAMYTGINSPGGNPSAAPVKFLGFEPNANS